MPQITAKTAPPTLMVIYTSAFNPTVEVLTASTFVGLAWVPGKNDVVLLPPLTDRYSGDAADFAVLLQQKLHADTWCYSVCHMSCTGELFQIWASHQYIMLVFVMVSSFNFQVLMWLILGGSTIVVFITPTLLSIPLSDICALWCWFMAIARMHWVATFLLPLSRGG